MIEDNPNPARPELEPDRLERLARELIEAGAAAGPITAKEDGSAQGLAFLLKDMTRPELKRLLERVDLSLPLSADGLETLEALKNLVAENRKLLELSVRDTLTGLYNRRYFRQRLRIELERVKRTEHPCSLIMIDLDRFKPVNDRYGHQTGDDLLRRIADIIQSNIRAVDVPIRYGGDEFAVILPDTDLRAAAKTAERIREHMAGDPRIAEYGVTGSFGLAAQHHFESIDLESLIERADQSMYRAKQEGGDRLWFFEAERLQEILTEVTPVEKEDLRFGFSEKRSPTD